VIEAIAAGKRATAAIDKYLGGTGVLSTVAALEREITGPLAEEGSRVKPESLPLEQRVGNFNEVELGYTEDQAVAEAKRCMRCDVREL